MEKNKSRGKDRGGHKMLVEDKGDLEVTVHTPAVEAEESLPWVTKPRRRLDALSDRERTFPTVGSKRPCTHFSGRLSPPLENIKISNIVVTHTQIYVQVFVLCYTICSFVVASTAST